MATASERNQQLLNNRAWQTKDFREQEEKLPPVLPNVNMQDNISVALRDPVYGQATATGLATGQSLLNTWINVANAKAQQARDKLANERWIKAQEDADADRQLRRDELAESKKRYLPGVSGLDDTFLSPEDKKALMSMNTNLARGKTLKDDVSYEQALDAQRQAIENRQKFLDSRRRNLNITGEALDVAGATKGMTKEQAMEKFGTQFAGSMLKPRFLGGTSGLEDRLSDLFYKTYKDSRFNRMTPIQFINRFEATGNQEGANKIRGVIGSLARDGYRIDEVLSGVRPEDPVYFRIGGELKLLEPNTMTLKDINLR